MTILDDIIAYKRDEVRRAKAHTPLDVLDALARQTEPPRGFRNALRARARTGPALICEIKKASPSKGVIREDFDPAAHACDYVAGGATCLSVLTDTPSFQGSADALRTVRDAVSLPILRKDFMIDPYQVAEARAWGSDCILIIMACTDDSLATDLFQTAAHYDLDVLVETHNGDEMARAAALGADLIGINNRNLSTFETRLETTQQLADLAPETALLVSESGIRDHGDIGQLTRFGARAFLVGESLMRANDIVAATKALCTNSTGNSPDE